MEQAWYHWSAESGMMHGVQTGAVWDEAQGLGRSRESKNAARKSPKAGGPCRQVLAEVLSASPCAEAMPMSSAEGKCGLEPGGLGQKGPCPTQWSLASGGLGWEIPSPGAMKAPTQGHY